MDARERDTAGKRQRLSSETAEEREARLSQRRLRRASETDETRERRLARDRARRLQRLASETVRSCVIVT